MKELKSFFIGEHHFSSIAGYVVAGLTVLQSLHEKGVVDSYTIILSVSLAILGRVAADGSKTKTGI